MMPMIATALTEWFNEDLYYEGLDVVRLVVISALTLVLVYNLVYRIKSRGW